MLFRHVKHKLITLLKSMKQLYFNSIIASVLLLVLSSCSAKYNFVTKGLPEKESIYIVTTKGQRIDATKLSLKRKVLTVNDSVYPLEKVSAIKDKKMYFAVNEGKLYQGAIYGKINLLYTVSNFYSGPVYGPASVGYAGSYGYNSAAAIPHSTTTYYLQKQGQPDVDYMKHRNFIDYVSDNPDALRKARASYLWNYASYGLGATAIAGLLYSVKLKDSNPAGSSTAGTIAGIAFPMLFITMSISNAKTRKAIKVYNQ